MPESVMQLLIYIIALIISIGGGYIVKYLSGKIGNDKLNYYYTIIKTIVMSIEQTQGSLSGIEKKQIAIEQIKKLLGDKVTEEEIDRLIEAAVYEIKKLIQSK